jgi:hypothetical protein
MAIRLDQLPPRLRAQVERKAFVEWARSHIQNDQARRRLRRRAVIVRVIVRATSTTPLSATTSRGRCNPCELKR